MSFEIDRLLFHQPTNIGNKAAAATSTTTTTSASALATDSKDQINVTAEQPSVFLGELYKKLVEAIKSSKGLPDSEDFQ